MYLSKLTLNYFHIIKTRFMAHRNEILKMKIVAPGRVTLSFIYTERNNQPN